MTHSVDDFQPFWSPNLYLVTPDLQRSREDCEVDVHFAASGGGERG